MFTFLFPISYFMLSLLYKIRSNVKEKYDKHRIVQRSVTFVGQGLLYFDRASEIDEGGNLAASKIRNLECPSYEICLIDYGCGKFNRKIHIMEQYP